MIVDGSHLRHGFPMGDGQIASRRLVAGGSQRRVVVARKHLSARDFHDGGSWSQPEVALRPVARPRSGPGHVNIGGW